MGKGREVWLRRREIRTVFWRTRGGPRGRAGGGADMKAG